VFFGRLTAEDSLVFFYTKSGHPLDEGISRLVVGIGRVVSIRLIQRYDSPGGKAYPVWDRLLGR